MQHNGIVYITGTGTLLHHSIGVNPCRPMRAGCGALIDGRELHLHRARALHVPGTLKAVVQVEHITLFDPVMLRPHACVVSIVLKARALFNVLLSN